MDKLYIVFATHTDRDIFVGFATGEVEDIEAYFDDRKAYGLRIEEAKPIKVEAGYAKRKNELAMKKAFLEAELRTLNNKMKKLQ